MTKKINKNCFLASTKICFGSKALIEVDGGVNLETGKLLVDAGAFFTLIYICLIY